MVLTDGTHLSFRIENKRASHATSFPDLSSRAAPDEAGRYIGDITIDLNGKKGPNRYSYDVFVLRVLEDGLGLRYRYNIQSSSCNIANSSSIGDTCAYWILNHNNMDYKYRDVSAEW